MKDYLIKITTHRWIMVLLPISMALCLLSEAFGSWRVGTTPPMILFLFCFLGLLFGWKTIYIDLDEMCIRYNLVLVKRRITIDRIHSLEIIIKDEECHLLFTIDDCPSLKKDKTSNHELYILKHPVKVISIQCNKEDAMACKHYFDSIHIHTDIIMKNSHRQDLR